MSALMPVADAIAALRAAGHCVTRTTRADAARRYGCETFLYVIDGQAVNVGRLRELARAVTCRPTLPGELTPPPAPSHGAAAPTLPTLRADAAAGRPVSLAALAGAITAERPAPTGEGLAGQPWDPGTPAARAAAALQGERAGILWPISQALTGAGVALPPTWQHGGPVMDGTVPLARALAALPLGAIATAAAALAALPPVTAAQDAALAVCRTGAVPGRPYL
jgi:hypothetical protein